jgi:hypothetical protein
MGGVRKAREELATSRQLIKSLRAAMGAMGRSCGGPRPPLDTVAAAAAAQIAAQLNGLGGLRAEPRGF